MTDTQSLGPTKFSRVPVLSRLQPDRLVNVIGAGAGLVVLLRFVLQAVPEPLPWMSELGELLYDASLAVLTGWFFHWLVVVRPRARDRNRIYQVVGENVRRLGDSGSIIAVTLGAETSVLISDVTHLTAQEWEEICNKLTSESTIARATTLLPGGGMRSMSAMEYLDSQFSAADRVVDNLLAAIPYFDADLVALIQEVQQQQSTLGQITRQLLPHGEVELGGFAGALDQYCSLCEKVSDYYRTHIQVHSATTSANVEGPSPESSQDHG